MSAHIGCFSWLSITAIACSQIALAEIPERSAVQMLLPQYEETLPAGENRPQFGSAVAVRTDTALIGMATHAEGGRVAVFVRDGQSWRRAGQLPCPPRACLFVGSIVMRDNIAVVAGYRSLLIFRKESGVWRFKDEIFRPDSGNQSFWHGGTQRYQDGFVVAEAVSANGPGAVYVFELGPSAKVQRAIRLAPSDSQSGDGFGAGIGMAKNTLVIGAPGVPRNGINSVGAAYVFERQSGEWVETQKLTAITGSLNDSFGSTVALNKGLLLIAARGANRVVGPSHSFEQGGVVYAFRKVNGHWKEQARFRPSIQDFSHYTDFGLKIVMFGDRAVISATELPFVGLGGVVAFEFRFPTTGYRPVSFVRGTSPGGIGLNQETLIMGVPSESRTSGIGHADVYDLGLPPE